jgi:hypothetical protein
MLPQHFISSFNSMLCHQNALECDVTSYITLTMSSLTLNINGIIGKCYSVLPYSHTTNVDHLRH